MGHIGAHEQIENSQVKNQQVGGGSQGLRSTTRRGSQHTHFVKNVFSYVENIQMTNPFPKRFNSIMTTKAM